MNLKVKKAVRQIPFYLVAVLLALLFTLALINTLKSFNTYTENVRGVEYATALSVISDSVLDLDLTNNSGTPITFSLISEDGEILYNSLTVARGESVATPNLSECYKPGVYPAQISIVFSDTQETVTKDITLYVQDMETLTT